MYKALRKHTISFKHAFDGVKHAFLHQPNLRIHTIVAIMVIAFSWYVGLSPVEWVIILFTVLWVIVSEMINTAIESIVDLVSREYSQEAKIAKDVAAGMVLVGAAGSIIVALIVLLPKLLEVV